MAPKVADVKSESWLDLTKEQPIKRPSWLPRRAQTQVPESSSSSSSSSGVAWSACGDLKKSRPLEGDHSSNNDARKYIQSNDIKRQQLLGTKIQESQMKYHDQQRSASFQAPTLSSSITGSSGSLQTSSRDHLLIRIRQESFRLSRRRSSLSDVQRRNQRSRSTTTTSIVDQEITRKLSQTTIMTKTMLETSATSSASYATDSSQLESQQHSSFETPHNHLIAENQKKESIRLKCSELNLSDLVKSEQQQQQQAVSANSSRLQRFKSRLEQRSRRSSSLLRVNPATDSSNEVDGCNRSEREDKSFFSHRSFSSLGDKFGQQLKRSWQKFLSNSSQSINQKMAVSTTTKDKLLHTSKSRAKRTFNGNEISLFSGQNVNVKMIPDDATDPINKLMLTESWLANHHQLERPRSLQISNDHSTNEFDYHQKNNNIESRYLIGVEAGSIGRDSSSSTTLVDSIISHQANQILSQAINEQQPRSSISHDESEQIVQLASRAHKQQISSKRAASLGPVASITQSSKFAKRLQSEIIPISETNKFASLKTDTEGSSTTTTTTSSCRTIGTCSSRCSLYNCDRRGKDNHMMQHHHNQSHNRNHSNKHRDDLNHSNRDGQISLHESASVQQQQQHAPILSFAPEDYYIDADAGPEAFEESNEDLQLATQHQLLSHHQAHLLSGHWPHATPTQNALRGHSVEAQLSTGGSSSLELSQAQQPTTSSSSIHPSSRAYNIAIDHNNPNLFLMQHHQQQQQQLLLMPVGQVGTNFNTQGDSFFEDPDYDDYAIPSDENFCRLDRGQVELVQMIGEGQKGFVFLGKLQSRDGRQIIDVAIKTLKYETELMIEKLMHEAAMMRQFEHPHIIRFIGVCPETPALIAMELAKLGELRHYLRSNQHLISVSQLVLFSFQISTALSYLESKQFVHRDVAARNVLVCSHTCVKLADFGLSRNLQMEPPGCQFVSPNSNHAGSLHRTRQSHLNNQQMHLVAKQQQHQLLLEPEDKSGHYVACSPGKLPVRWLAPESLTFRRFTSASDVWMFAVCTWEIFYLGQLRPWPHIANNQVLSAIGAGERLTRPPACPSRLYALMLQCWSFAPIQRPKFRDIKQELWSIYLAERTREQILLEQVKREKQECNQMLAMEAARQEQQSQLDQAHQRRMRRILYQQNQHQQQSHHHHQQQQHVAQVVKSSYNPASPEPSEKDPNLKVSSVSSSVSANSSLSQKRRLLLRDSGGLTNSQSVPNNNTSSPTPSPTQKDQQLADDSERSSQRFRRRNQLQKQRSQGSIIGLAGNGQVDRNSSSHPLVEGAAHSGWAVTPRLRHKDDQALLEMTKLNQQQRSSRQPVLGDSERLLEYPPRPNGIDHSSTSHSNNHRQSGHLNEPGSGNNALVGLQAADYEGLASRRAELDKQMQHLSQEFSQVMQLSGQHQLDLSPAQKRELEQRNRLDLHRRLLGHIRPASSASSSRARDRANRNSLNLSSHQATHHPPNEGDPHNMQHGHGLSHSHTHNLGRPLPHPPSMSQATRVESVDQSLEILASLISPQKSDQDYLLQHKPSELARSHDGKTTSSIPPVAQQQQPRPKSRESELQQQWRRIGREFGEKVGLGKQSNRNSEKTA